MQLIDVVLKQVTTFDEVGSMIVDGQLDLTKDGIVKFYVDKDIIGSTLESIFNSHYFELVWILFAYPLYLFVYPDNLSFF